MSKVVYLKVPAEGQGFTPGLDFKYDAPYKLCCGYEISQRNVKSIFYLGGERSTAFFPVDGTAGVFSCDRQELDMKGTANSKYDLINYICQ